MGYTIEAKISRIVIIESKETIEPNNGWELFQRHQEDWKKLGADPDYRSVDSVPGLVEELDRLTAEVPRKGTPILHLDMHGEPSGLMLSNAGNASWEILRHPLARLNRACNGNLIIVVGACDGLSLWKSLAGDGPPPFLAYAGLPGTVNSLAFCDALHGLYRELLESHSFDLATAAANKVLAQRGCPELHIETALKHVELIVQAHLTCFHHRHGSRLHAAAILRARRRKDLREHRVTRDTLSGVRDELRSTPKTVERLVVSKMGLAEMPQSPVAAMARELAQRIGRMSRLPNGKAFRRRYLAEARKNQWAKLGASVPDITDQTT
jgi:hypothetical protein